MSYCIYRNDYWEKGFITKITKDSLYVSSKRVVKSSDDSLVGYRLNEFSNIVFPEASRVVGGTVLVAGIIVVGLLSMGVVDVPIEDGSIFKKNLDFDDGWEMEVINCD